MFNHTEYNRDWRKKFPLKAREAVCRYHNKHPSRLLLACAKYRAKKRGLLFTLKETDLIIPMTCPVLGIPVIFDRQASRVQRNRPNSPSVDRIDPCGGYTPDNVRVISWRANELKRNGTLAEFRAIVADLEKRDV